MNGLDVDPFVEVLLSGPYQTEADMNEDQVVNGLDVDPFVAAVVGGVHARSPSPRPSSSASSLWAWSADGGSGACDPVRPTKNPWALDAGQLVASDNQAFLDALAQLDAVCR